MTTSNGEEVLSRLKLLLEIIVPGALAPVFILPKKFRRDETISEKAAAIQLCIAQVTVSQEKTREVEGVMLALDESTRSSMGFEPVPATLR